jgi:hypothetical protein
VYSSRRREHDDRVRRRRHDGSRTADVDVTNPRRSMVDDKKEKALHGDFAGGERTRPMTRDAEESALLEGDFAKGERKVPLTEKEKREAEMHGDFAGGERTEPLTPESVEEGSFASDKK